MKRYLPYKVTFIQQVVASFPGVSGDPFHWALSRRATGDHLSPQQCWVAAIGRYGLFPVGPWKLQPLSIKEYSGTAQFTWTWKSSHTWWLNHCAAILPRAAPRIVPLFSFVAADVSNLLCNYCSQCAFYLSSAVHAVFFSFFTFKVCVRICRRILDYF